MDGIRLAVSWLSVLPVQVNTVDARTCRQAIAFAPLVGALLGGFAALSMWALTALAAPSLLAGLLTVGALALATRGMHIDGLADTVDGFGCYGSAERALAVMRDGSTGPFAVVAIVLALGTQAVSFAALARTGDWSQMILACAAGRASFMLSSRRGVLAARQEGMGALVAGSQPLPAAAAWWLALAALAALAADTWWIGLLAIAVTAAGVLALIRHARRRIGGVTGDILGAACELATTLALVLFTFA